MNEWAHWARDGHSIHVWNEGQDGFVEKVCRDASIPTSGYRFRKIKPQETQDESNKQHFAFSGDIPESVEIMDTPAALLSWDRLERCFLFITDSKSLHETVCGKSALKKETDVHIFERIANHIVALYGFGWRPPRLSDDPVVWMARSHDKVADGLADLTMDQGRSWKREYVISQDPLKANWVIQTDGGRRSENCAAAALVIGIWVCNGEKFQYEPWFAQGTFLVGGATVFQTEAIALDKAVKWSKQTLETLKRQDE